MCNVSFIACMKGVHRTQESKRPNSVWAEWVPNTFPFHNLASKFRSFGQVDLALSLFYFGQFVTRTKSHIIIWQFITRTQSHVIFQIFKYVFFYSINDKGTIQSCIYIQFFFSFLFCIKNKWRLHTTYPKIEMPLKASKSHF